MPKRKDQAHGSCGVRNEVNPCEGWVGLIDQWTDRLGIRLDHFSDERDCITVKTIDTIPSDWINTQQYCLPNT